MELSPIAPKPRAEGHFEKKDVLDDTGLFETPCLGSEAIVIGIPNRDLSPIF